MWALENKTPYEAERSFLRDKDGSEIWIVVVRATFDILPDHTTRISEEQVPVVVSPQYVKEPGKSSLKYDTDMVIKKQTTDIYILGNAHAPGKKPVKNMLASMQVGPVKKQLKVFGDRYWEKGLLGICLSEPKQFTCIPIIYERAYGGTDISDIDPKKIFRCHDNPIGTGVFAEKKKRLIGKRAPNFEYPDQPNQPAGFGPIPMEWQSRHKYAGTYDDKWQNERQPLLPEDFDDRFYQCAPKDQQAPRFLRGGESVILKNLSSSGLTTFSLPKVWLTFTTRFEDTSIEHRSKLHTVIIEPEIPRLQMVWQTRLDCHPKIYKLLKTTIREKEYISL